MLKPSEKRLVILGLGLLAACGLFFYVYEPISAKWSVLSSEIARLEKKVEDGKQLSEAYPVLNNSYTRARNFIALFDDLSKDQGSLSALKRLDELAKKAGVSVREIKPLTSKVVDNFRLLPIQLSFAADMDKLVGFIREIELEAAYFEIERVSLSPGGSSGGAVEANILVMGCSWAGKPDTTASVRSIEPRLKKAENALERFRQRLKNVSMLGLANVFNSQIKTEPVPDAPAIPVISSAAPIRKPQPAAQSPVKPPEPQPELKGIVSINGEQIALISYNGKEEYYHSGDSFGGISVKEITEDIVIVSGPFGTKVLQLSDAYGVATIDKTRKK